MTFRSMPGLVCAVVLSGLGALLAAACSNLPNPPQPGPVPPPPPTPTTYSISVLPVPAPYADARAADINEAGVIVGWAKDMSTSPSSLRAVRWQNGVMTDLGGPSIADYNDPTIVDVNSWAEGISSTGVIVGTFQIERDDPLAFPSETIVDSAFRWTASTGFERLPGLGQGDTRAYAVNGAGVAVGQVLSPYFNVAVRWAANGTITQLQPGGGAAARDINEEGWIAGDGAAGGNRHAHLWRPGGVAGDNVMPFISGLYIGHALNASRDIVGRYLQVPSWSSGPDQAFRWTVSSGVATLVVPTCGQAMAFDISDQGRVVGVCGLPGPRAFTTRAGAFEILPLPPKGVSAIATAVNKCGTVVGEAFDTMRKLAVRWAPANCDP